MDRSSRIPGTTGFFRDAENLAAVRDALRSRARTSASVPWIWSAGCAGGQEPYSLAMVLCEESGSIGTPPMILATDVDESALRYAKAGRYEAAETAHIPAAFRSACLGPADAWGRRPIRARMRSRVRFRHHDLRCDAEPKESPFSAILCRNLLMHHHEAERAVIVDRLRRTLEPGGLLVTGFQEHLPVAGSEHFADLGGGLYRLRDAITQRTIRTPREETYAIRSEAWV